jgi:ribonuclease P protein component
MLPKVNRLKKKKEFEKVFKKGRFLKEDFLILKAIPNNLKNSRFGFIISSKVSKKAVVRNKIKRWLRNIILFKLKEDNQMKEMMDVVIIVKPGILIKNFQEVEVVINKIFQKLKNAKY